MMLKRIKNLREDRDWTQKRLAETLNISRSAYSAYENGANALPLEVLKKLAVLYNVSADYILELTDDPAPYGRGRSKIKGIGSDK